jgi:hypothetical protein
LGFRALVVACPGAESVDPGRGKLLITGELPWHELMECIARSRLALFPNTLDPSPRLIAEALCLDTPILVNREILGGWKYVTAATGAFFSSTADAVSTARLMISTDYLPREWFVANYGPSQAGRRLATFLEQLG